MTRTLLGAIQHQIDLSKIEGLAERGQDLRPVWQHRVQPIVTAFLRARFDTEGAHMTGAKWAPLQPRTIRERAKPGRGRGGIGRDTNRLWGSLVKSGGSSAPEGGILVMEPDRYMRGTTVPYAAAFSSGLSLVRRARLRKADRIATKRGRGGRMGSALGRRFAQTQPARPIFGDPVPTALTDQFTAAVARYLQTGKP